MTTLLFVRHAHSPWVPNREAERPLSTAGRVAAQRVADQLDDRRIDAVVSSPYERARQTVEPLAVRRDLDVRTDDGFRERALADGPVETVGETFESAVDAVWSDWSFAWPGGESSDEAQARGVAAVERILDRHEGETVAVGTHGQLLTATLHHYDDRFDRTFWREALTTPDVYEARFEGAEMAAIRRLYEPAE
ncbi:histidine phosphatase family protein [Halomarina salina]|uniref:Histidine phosphatase family protein n=1 Tax=Halomarina salina TaxID=1872699 RepID=A0ABD5RIV1_9EURY|nr:histidine phosphatase family protein [Halomarina salina]